MPPDIKRTILANIIFIFIHQWMVERMQCNIQSNLSFFILLPVMVNKDIHNLNYA